MINSCKLIVPYELHAEIMRHLFPGDGDEHGLVILAGVANVDGCLRLLAREVVYALDGVDYVQGRHSHRSLRAAFIQPLIKKCREQKLAYIAVHNHGGTNRVSFSYTDLHSHEQGYPGLLELSGGMPVGAAVYAKRAVAGDIWLPDGRRLELNETRIIGSNIVRLTDCPHDHTFGDHDRDTYDRQIRMFGEKGQQILRNSVVGVIGAGGVGSLAIEQLARLGVGKLVVADPDRIETSNLSRVVGATRWDAKHPFTSTAWPAWVRNIAQQFATKKCAITERVARAANPSIKFESYSADFAKDDIARKFLQCDFLILAADSMRARLVFNAMVHQYFIPGIQIGSKIVAEEDDDMTDAFSVIRWVRPGSNCLWCTGMISSHQLAIEAKSEIEKADQAYGTESPSPSVITMNAIGAAQGCNDALFSLLALHDREGLSISRRFKHPSRRMIEEVLHRDDECPECGVNLMSRMGKGDAMPLPTLVG